VKIDCYDPTGFMRKNLSEQRRKILVVEDYTDAREMYVDFLEHEGFDVVTATNGREAVESARAQHPDLILMDLSLPLVDGCAATRILKAARETRDIPVLAVTGHVMGNMPAEAADSGVTEVVAKPCPPYDLLSKIRRVLDDDSDR
jgi:two-component system, cell cycle response regulator DivK